MTEQITESTVVTNAETVEACQPVDAVITVDDKAPEIKKPKAPAPKYNWTKSWYESNPDYLQASHMTSGERFPLIFDNAKKLYPDAKRVLSFGCSTGEEVEALAKRFPDAEIVGVDLDYSSISRARKSNKLPNVFFHTDLGATGKYDLVTALMVFFCMEEPIPKDRFINNLLKLDKYINPNGVLMIYTSDYNPKEVLGEAYEDLNVWKRVHNKNNKEYYNGYYRKKGDGVLVFDNKLEIDPSTMPTND